MYKKLSLSLTEEKFRQIWEEEFCRYPILTFDNIEVKFYSSMFNHCFYESDNRKERDKSILSLNRLEKMLWIKDTLQDTTALIRKGWDRDKKRYVNTRRIALVKGNYIVVIQLFGNSKARFITAYEMQEEDNIKKIISSPLWEKEKNAD